MENEAAIDLFDKELDAGGWGIWGGASNPNSAKAGATRVVVSGTVNYQGKPIPKGTIRFVPTGENPRFEFGRPNRTGPIRWCRPRGACSSGPNASRSPPSPRARIPSAGTLPRWKGPALQYLPPKYNRQSTLTATIEPGGPAKHDFDLQ